MIVVDASVVVDMLIGEERGARILPSEDLVAPHLVDAEVVSAIRRDVLVGRIGRSSADAVVSDFLDLEIERYPHPPLVPRAWSLRANVTVYDGLYVALAELLGVALLTLDRRLAAAPGTDAEITLL